MAEDENKIARDTLENVNVRARIERLDQMRIKADVEIVQKNEVINHSQNEIGKRNAIIERKQNAIDQYNKKLEQMITAAGVSLDKIFLFFFILAQSFGFLMIHN